MAATFFDAFSRPLVRSLVKKGFNRYPLNNSRMDPLIQSGKFQDLTFGKQLIYLWNDTLVRDVVSSLGFEVDRIVETADGVNGTRNKSEHKNIDCSPAEAIRVRDLVLHCGLKALFRGRRS